MLMAAARIREDIERVGLLHQLMNQKKETTGITTVLATDNNAETNSNNTNIVPVDLKVQFVVSLSQTFLVFFFFLVP